MITKNSHVVAVQEQVSTDLGGEVAILHLQSGIYYSLNETGARVWDLIQETQSVSAVLAALLDEYDVAEDDCERYVLALLNDLHAEKLIQVRNGASS